MYNFRIYTLRDGLESTIKLKEGGILQTGYSKSRHSRNSNSPGATSERTTIVMIVFQVENNYMRAFL